MPTGSPNAGYRTFNTGDVLTAAQVQYYLQNQSIMYFADAAARDAALTAGIIQEGMFAYLADTDSTVFYNGSSWESITDLNNTTLTSPKETVDIIGAGATGTINLDVLTSAVQVRTGNASGNWILNVRGDGSNSLNSLMTTGEQISVVLAQPNGATAYYPTGFHIDSVVQTPLWLGGSAPSSGNINSTDVYVYTIIKTSAATFTVFASQSKFA